MNSVIDIEKKESFRQSTLKSKAHSETKTKQSGDAYNKLYSSSELTLSYASKNWKEILKLIQQNRPSISAMLEDYYPVDFDQNVLYIQSKTGAVFNERIINNGKQLLEQHFKSIFRNKVVVEIKLEKKIKKQKNV